MSSKHLIPFLSWCIFLITANGFAQTATVKGNITSSNHPADNVSVVLKGTKIGTVTDNNGNYEIKNIKPGNYTLKVSAVGFSSKEKSITVQAGDEILENFAMSSSSEGLEEVFVRSNTNKYTKSESDYVSRMSIKNLENAQVYNVVTKELMRDQLVTNQDDALKNVPGMYQLWASTGRAGDGGSYFSSRGFVTQSLIRNGIAGKITNNADAVNLERIESIKGPSATLFGSILTSYGGLINRVTKKPHEGFAGEIGYQTGSYGFNRLTADINTSLNDENTALLRVNAAYTNTNTFQDYGSSRSFFFAPSFSYKVSDRLTISLDAEISNIDASSLSLIYIHWNQTPTTLGFNSAADLNMDFKRSFSGDEFITSNKTANIFAQANYKISDKWNSQTILSTSNNKSGGPQTWFYLIGNNQMSRNAWLANGNDNITEFQQNFNGEFNIGKMRNRFLVGGDIYHIQDKISYGYFPGFGNEFDIVDYTSANSNYYEFNPTNVNARFVGGEKYKTQNTITTYSAYVSDVINITDKLILSAGLRFDNFDNKGIYDPSSNTTTGNYSQNALSPKFGVVYQIIKDQVSAFGNYQNSFSNNGYLNANVNGALQLVKFDPEQANQFEAGVKINAFKNKLSANLSYYNIKVEDIVRADASLPNASIQDGNQISKGFEAEITGNPIPGLNFNLGYAFNDSKFEKADANVNGLRPVTAGPENLINYWVSYTLQTTQLKGLGIGFGGNYADATLIYNYNAIDGSGNAFVETFSLPSYSVLNASINYDQPKYRFSLKMNNLTDELYFNGYTTINVQAPRTIMGAVTYKF